MQIVELYMRGAKRIFGNITGVDSGFGTISDSNAQFLIFAEVGDVITNLQTGEQDIITAIVSIIFTTSNKNLADSFYFSISSNQWIN